MPNTATVETQSSTARSLDHRTLWQRVHEHLREEILSGRLPAGHRAPGGRPRRVLGVSRGPIREAIGRLAAEGLVTVRPRRGAVVRALSNEEFLEAYQVREALEMMAVRLAVPRLTAEDVARWSNDRRDGLARRRATTYRGSSRRTPAFHLALLRRVRQPDAAELYRAGCCGQIDRLPAALPRAARQRPALDRRAQGDPARGAGGRRRARVHLVSEHIRVPQIRCSSMITSRSAAGDDRRSSSASTSTTGSR